MVNYGYFRTLRASQILVAETVKGFNSIRMSILASMWLMMLKRSMISMAATV